MRVYTLSKPGSIENLALRETSVPTPKANEVLVRIQAVSLNFRDLMIAKGSYRASPPTELIPCSDGAGEVVDVGPGVTRVKPGDRVAGIFHQRWLGGPPTDTMLGSALGGDIHGVLAEYALLHEDGVVQLPEHLSYDEGATLPCAAVTAWYALFAGRPVLPGETVLTLGTGGVSLFALQFARAAGARVFITSSSDEKLERARSLGAVELINYRKHEQWHEQVLQRTGGLGADHVVELGGPGTLPRSLQAVRRGGTVSIIGVLTGAGQIDPMPILFKHISVRGIFVGSRETFEAMNRAIEANQIRPVIDKVFSFDEAIAAYRYLESGAHFGKVVIRVG